MIGKKCLIIITISAGTFSSDAAGPKPVNDFARVV